MGRLNKAIPLIERDVEDNTEQRHWHDNKDILDLITSPGGAAQEDLDFLRKYSYMIM